MATFGNYLFALLLGNLLALLFSSATAILPEHLSAPANMDEENLKNLAKANNGMAVNIHRQLARQTSDNIFFSPLSLSTAFGMLYYGTKGDTAKELRQALGYDTAGLQDDLVHQSFHKYLTEYLLSKDPSAYVINSANSILLDKQLNLVPSYKNDVQNLYQASVQDVDFLNQGPQIVNEINSWVKNKTNGKIDKVLDHLDPSTVLVLLNAVYFKGAWETPFEKRKTRPQMFYNYGLDSKAKEVPMMSKMDSFYHAYMSDFRVLELPYKGENMSMVVLLPEKLDGLTSLEENLTFENISVIRTELFKRKVRVTIPKFKIEYSKEMSSDFESLGAKSVFTPGGDLSGISPDPNIAVSQVFHKAVVEVNEEGSEAAGATGIGIEPLSRPPAFIADHPFLFAIVDDRNDMILFMGRVTNL